MKRIISILFFLLMFTTIANASTMISQSNKKNYIDDHTGLQFTIPKGWIEKPVTENSEIIKCKFVFKNDPSVCVLYGSSDLWSKLSSTEKEGYTQSDCDNSMITKSDIAQMYGISESDVSVVAYNHGLDEYYQCVVPYKNGTKSDVMTQMIYINNGVFYNFQFTGTSSSLYFSDFVSILNSVSYPFDSSSNSTTTNDNSVATTFSFNDFLGSLILTIVLYSLPIIIYRYGIRKKPVIPKKALIITIIYGICALILMVVIAILLGGHAPGYAIVFWSFINYKMLKGGTDYKFNDINEEKKVKSASEGYFEKYVDK